ncbi:hypothetical protein FJZ36_11185 [Candidatus Poribacteria bacterium]|nr:hypothetical protein [Candidatus Poribacteria bacterium]
MERTEAVAAALTQIREHLLIPLAMHVREVTPDVAWRWRQQMHVLDYFVRRTLGSPASDETAAMLATSGGLLRLLTENIDALEEIKDYEWARGLSAASDAASIAEEVLSGEDQTLRDALLDALMFGLNWKSNTFWVDAGKKAHRATARSYTVEIEDELWEFLSVASGVADDDMTLERARRIGVTAERVIATLRQSGMPTNAQVALLAHLYQWVLRLRMGRLLIVLEHESQEQPPDTPSVEPNSTS